MDAPSGLLKDQHDKSSSWKSCTIVHGDHLVRRSGYDSIVSMARMLE